MGASHLVYVFFEDQLVPQGCSQFLFAGKCDPTRTFRANEAEGSSLLRDGWWGLLGCHRLHCELFE